MFKRNHRCFSFLFLNFLALNMFLICSYFCNVLLVITIKSYCVSSISLFTFKYFYHQCFQGLFQKLKTASGRIIRDNFFTIKIYRGHSQPIYTAFDKTNFRNANDRGQRAKARRSEQKPDAVLAQNYPQFSQSSVNLQKLVQNDVL